VDSWGHDSYLYQTGPQGLFMKKVQDSYLIEENFFDHCGWNEDVPNAGANMFNHNIYIQYDNVAGGIIRGNIIARGAAHGIQARSGGLVDRNLFILNAVSLNIGGNGYPTESDVYTFPNRAWQNVAISGRRMDPNNSNLPRTAAVWGIMNSIHIPGALFEDNIVANRIHSGSNQAYVMDGSPVMVDNIAYAWRAEQDMFDPAWPHPDDDMGDYYASIGGTNSTIDYLNWLRNRPLRTLDWEMTAYAGINYIREGFNKAPVSGYYDYEGAPSPELISDGSFGASSINNMPNPYIVGVHATDNWQARAGTGGQASYIDSSGGNYYVVAGSGNTNGTFQVITWPGSGDVELQFEYRGHPVVRILGGEPGDEISKFFAPNDLTLLGSATMTNSNTWAPGSLNTTISGSYSHLVIQFIDGDIDNVSATLQ
jgi:hypothetical protein